MAQVPTNRDRSGQGNEAPARGGFRRRHRRRADVRRPVVVAGIALIVVAAIAMSFGLAGASPAASAIAVLPPPTATAPLATTASAGPLASASAARASAGPASHGPGIRANRIVVPAVGIDLPVIEGDGVDAPFGKAAHYPGTGWPGSGTNVYLYAHARDGMFIGLWDVTVGDEIDLHLVDGTSRSYVVRRVLPKVAWNAIQYLDPTPTEQLTLQTCTSYQETAPRFLVIAEPRP